MLEVGPDVSRQDIVQRAQDRASAEADAAAKALLAPRTRLEAEVAFLPGADTATAEQVVHALREGREPNPWSLSVPARANLFAHLIGAGPPRADRLTEFVQIHGRLEREDLASLVSADRSAAQMPKPMLEALERAAESLVEVHAEALAAGAARLGAAPGSMLLSALISGTAPAEERRAGLLRLAAAAWARETASQVAEAEERATRAEEALATAADRAWAEELASAIADWASLTAPQRAADTAAALLHRPTQEAVQRWRRLTLDLVSERDAPATALPIVQTLAANFGDIPELGPRLQQDLEACQDLAREAVLQDRPEAKRLERAITAARADLATLARYLDGSEPTGPGSGTLAELIAAFRAAAQAGLGPLPWLALRSFALWLHNEQQQTAPALSLARVMQRAIGQPRAAEDSQDDALAELRALIEADITTLRRELASRKLEAAMKAGHLQDALASLDELLQLPAEASTRAELQKLHATIKAKLRARKGKRLFWSAAAAVFVLWLVMGGEQRTPARPSPPIASSSYSAAPPQQTTSSSQLAWQSPSSDTTEAKPVRGSQLTLTLPEVRWCEFQKRRIPAARAFVEQLQASSSYLTSEVDRVIDRFNAIIDEYNAACPGRTYYQRDKQQADAQVAERGPQFDREGRQLMEAAVPPRPAAPRPAPITGFTASQMSPAAAPAATAAPERGQNLSFEQGWADRVAWERWVAAQSGDSRAGAEWWAGQRSLPRPGTCESGSPAFSAGCSEAYRRLAPSDARRRSDPDYRRGWNSYVNPAPPTTQPASAAAAAPWSTGPSATSSFQQGQSDRAAWEQWFASLSDSQKAGAEYWAGQRSLPRPGTCESSDAAFTAGCTEARRRLSPSDARRRNDPEYRRGWNSY